MTLKAILAAAAVLAATPVVAYAGDYRYLDENEEGRGFIELPFRANADGHREAPIILMFAPVDEDSRAVPVARMTMSIDCERNRFRIGNPEALRTDMSLIGRQSGWAEWGDIEPGSRGALVYGAACKGETLPPAGGDDLKDLARDYFASKRH